MLINGGVVVCKFFLANVRQCFEMGGVIQGGMLPQWEDDHGLITINREVEQLTSNKFSKKYNVTVFAMNVICFSIHW